MKHISDGVRYLCAGPWFDRNGRLTRSAPGQPLYCGADLTKQADEIPGDGHWYHVVCARCSSVTRFMRDDNPSSSLETPENTILNPFHGAGN